MKKFIYSIVMVGLALGMGQRNLSAANDDPPDHRAQVWTWGGQKNEEGRVSSSTLTLTLAHKLRIVWDGMVVNPDDVKDRGNGLIVWEGALGGHYYYVRMSVTDSFLHVHLQYDVCTARGGALLYRGSATLAKHGS